MRWRKIPTVSILIFGVAYAFFLKEPRPGRTPPNLSSTPAPPTSVPKEQLASPPTPLKHPGRYYREDLIRGLKNPEPSISELLPLLEISNYMVQNEKGEIVFYEAMGGPNTYRCHFKRSPESAWDVQCAEVTHERPASDGKGDSLSPPPIFAKVSWNQVDENTFETDLHSLDHQLERYSYFADPIENQVNPLLKRALARQLKPYEGVYSNGTRRLKIEGGSATLEGKNLSVIPCSFPCGQPTTVCLPLDPQEYSVKNPYPELPLRGLALAPRGPNPEKGWAIGIAGDLCEIELSNYEALSDEPPYLPVSH